MIGFPSASMGSNTRPTTSGFGQYKQHNQGWNTGAADRFARNTPSIPARGGWMKTGALGSKAQWTGPGAPNPDSIGTFSQLPPPQPQAPASSGWVNDPAWDNMPSMEPWPGAGFTVNPSYFSQQPQTPQPQAAPQQPAQSAPQSGGGNSLMALLAQIFGGGSGGSGTANRLPAPGQLPQGAPAIPQRPAAPTQYTSPQLR